MDSQLGFLFQAPTRRVWTVRDLVSAARTALEREYTDIYVEGEISNFRPADSGHLYFTLKDGDAQLRIVMFQSKARLLRFKPTNGMQVIARGRVTVYEQRGELQLSAEFLEPKGAGALQIAFEQLKAKLAAEGLFDPARKKPMPAMPKRIGVVTSPRGAAVQDILNVLQRRHEDVHIVIYPAQVQGDAAAAEVAAGVRYFNRAAGVDVIVVARGGGSAEDLAAFNDEELARVIAASEIPVVSAVGHETDFTIADFVADLRAPTPSAAAEMVIESKHQIARRVEDAHARLARAARYRLMMARNILSELAKHSVFARMAEFLQRRAQRRDELAYRLAQAQAAQLQWYRTRVEVATSRVRTRDMRLVLQGMAGRVEASQGRLTAAARQRLMQQKARVEQASGKLAALSPLNILERGYAIVFDAQGNVVKDEAQVDVGQEIRARVARGELGARVTRKSGR